MDKNLNYLIDAINDHLLELDTQESIVIVTIAHRESIDLMIYSRVDGVEIARQEIPSTGNLQEALTFTSHFDGDCWITMLTSF